MRKFILGDYDTLMGIEKPSKIKWLMERGVNNIEGVQIISLPQDMIPKNLLTYHEKLLDLVDKFSFLKRISVALLCWPNVKEKDGTGVAASTFLTEDLFFYPWKICQALQKVHNEKGIGVDISYHPMATWPRIDAKNINPVKMQQIFFDWEQGCRRTFCMLLEDPPDKANLRCLDVVVNIENEPPGSDSVINLLHMFNRGFTEISYDLRMASARSSLVRRGGTFDLQHCGMFLKCLQENTHLDFPPFGPSGSNNPGQWNWPAQFATLYGVDGDITFHVAQVEDPLKHITPPIRWDDPIMDWPLILRLMKELDSKRNGQVWYTAEIDGGHLHPEGYRNDLEALLYLQEYFGR